MSRRRRRARRRGPPTARALALPFLRRRSTKWLVAAIITLGIGILLGVLGSRDGDSDDTPTGPTPTLAVALPDLAPEADVFQPAEVVRVIDGDTIEVRIGGDVETVRYYGVDTPERGDECFDEATDRNAALVGDAVLLLPDARERDPFDRLLRYVFDEDGESIDARLIAEGLALAWTADGAFRDDLVALEEDARAAGAGCLWEG
ncbi:MAG: thermonuclease family protein [Dehalococcoidia bacterium]